MKNKLDDYAKILDEISKNASSLTQDRDRLRGELSLREGEMSKLKERLSLYAILVTHLNKNLNGQYIDVGPKYILGLEGVVGEDGNRRQITFNYFECSDKATS